MLALAELFQLSFRYRRAFVGSRRICFSFLFGLAEFVSICVGSRELCQLIFDLTELWFSLCSVSQSCAQLVLGLAENE